MHISIVVFLACQLQKGNISLMWPMVCTYLINGCYHMVHQCHRHLTPVLFTHYAPFSSVLNPFLSHLMKVNYLVKPPYKRKKGGNMILILNIKCHRWQSIILPSSTSIEFFISSGSTTRKKVKSFRQMEGNEWVCCPQHWCTSIAYKWSDPWRFRSINVHMLTKTEEMK